MNDIYQAPQDSANPAITPVTRIDITALSGWLWIMSIITFASIVLSLIGLATLFSFGIHSTMIVTLVTSVVGIAFTLLNAIFLLQAARAYKSYIKTHNPYDLERGLKAQRNYFVLLGIYVIFAILIVILGFFAAFLGGMMMSGY